MNLLDTIHEKISELLNSLVEPTVGLKETDAIIDTASLLYDLAEKQEWSESDIIKINSLSKSFDIGKKLWAQYDKNWKKVSNDILSERLWNELWTALLLKNLVLAVERKDLLKRFNVFYKALDEHTPSWLAKETELGIACELLWKKTCNDLCSELFHGQPDTQRISLLMEKKNLETLPLTVLFYEGPIARAYLETIYSLGYQPEKIIELIPSKNALTKKTLGKWLPENIRKIYARNIFANQIHHWPKYLKKQMPVLIENIMEEIEKQWQFSPEIINRAQARYQLSTYSNAVESLLVDNLHDATLQKFFSSYASNHQKRTILFTGGGIVPASLLTIPNLYFLHLHPGYLPDIRGADCALWSLLLSGHMSATCFYMSPGIDTGDIILPCWLPKMTISAFSQEIDLKMQYRALYSFIDPWIRAFVLRKIIQLNWAELPTQIQTEATGQTYHFMHPKLQKKALSILAKNHSNVI